MAGQAQEREAREEWTPMTLQDRLTEVARILTTWPESGRLAGVLRVVRAMGAECDAHLDARCRQAERLIDLERERDAHRQHAIEVERERDLAVAVVEEVRRHSHGPHGNGYGCLLCDAITKYDAAKCSPETSATRTDGPCFVLLDPPPLDSIHPPPEPICAVCGGPVEEARKCYAIPTCYRCLPPPPPIPPLDPVRDVIGERPTMSERELVAAREQLAPPAKKFTREEVTKLLRDLGVRLCDLAAAEGCDERIVRELGRIELWPEPKE